MQIVSHQERGKLIGDGSEGKRGETETGSGNGNGVRKINKLHFVTFRLADSLPRELLDDWLRSRDTFLAANPPPWDDITEACYHGKFSDKLDEHLDAAHGSCALRDPRLAQIVADRLHHFDGQRYDLWSYVIMPNHVHVLFTLRDGESLPDTLQGWKGVSSRLIQKTGLSTLNPFWQPDYFDRLFRSPEHFNTVKAYIRENPAKAGLMSGFPFGSEANERCD